MTVVWTRPGTARLAVREIECVIDHLHRDARVAADARIGAFTHSGVRLLLGRRPDWVGGGLVDDEEWRIEWVKFYEGLDLAHTCRETGDLEYFLTWVDLVDSFCRQVPVGFDSSDVTARRIQNWLYALQRFGPDVIEAALPVEVEARIEERLAADVGHLRDHLTPERNHRTLELYALFIAALAVPDVVDPDGDLLRFALVELQLNALTDIWGDGTHRECSTDYHHIVLRSFLGTILNARRFELRMRPSFLRRVEAAAEWALHVQRPDGTIPSFSDGDNGDFRAVLALAGDLFFRPDFHWVASGGTRGIAPKERWATFPVGGYVVQRSGWGEQRPYRDECFALLDCGPIGDGGHGHYDQLHVELVAGPNVLAVDPGRYTYVDGPWRRYFKGTAGHNTVTVDGLDQIPYRKGKPKGKHSEARLDSRHRGDQLDLVEATVVSPNYDAVHTRRLAFCGNEYWVVHDQLRAPTVHDYELRWHLAPWAQDLVTLDAAGGLVTVTTPRSRFVVQGAASVTIEEGWVSEEYGVKHAAPVIVARLTASSADFVTAVFGEPESQVLYAEAGSRGCAMSVMRKFAGGSTLDVLDWPTPDAPLDPSRVRAPLTASWHRVGTDRTTAGEVLVIGRSS